MILRTAALVLGASLVTSLCLAAPAASSAAASLQAFKSVQAQSKAGASANWVRSFKHFTEPTPQPARKRRMRPRPPRSGDSRICCTRPTAISRSTSH